MAVSACMGSARITVAAVGDVLLHGPLQRHAYGQDAGFRAIWAEAEPILQAADIAYANLEGPTAAGVARGQRVVRDPGKVFDNRVYTSYPMFNYHPSLLDDLTAAGVDVVSTANNHSLDRGPLGVDRTLDALATRQMAFTGTVRQGAPRRFAAYTETRLGRIAWLACSYGTNGLADPFDQVLLCFGDRAELLAETARLARDPGNAAVIVTPHWGNEYQTREAANQRALAADLAEAGATAIIGAHPHVLQPWAVLPDRTGAERVPVLYSLGNFVSNQRSTNQRSAVVAELDFCPARLPADHVAAFGAPRLTVATLRYTPIWMTFGAGGPRLRLGEAAQSAARVAARILPEDAAAQPAPDPAICKARLTEVLAAFED